MTSRQASVTLSHQYAERPSLGPWLAIYFFQIWQVRHFWLHLALSDLRAKFRRSSLGVLWAVLNPLMFTLLLTFVMGAVFKTPVLDYAPFVFSGIITWEFIVSSAMMGCTAFINAEGYIKQYNHPLGMYALRYVIVALLTFLLGLIGCVLWVFAWKPGNINLSILSLVITLPILVLTAWPLAIITAFINTRFRDFSQLIVIVFQAIWYASPIFIEPRVLRKANLHFLIDLNPVYHFLNLVRAPLLSGVLPSPDDFAFALGVAALFWLVALYYVKKHERSLIFFL